MRKAVLFDLDGVLVDACDWHYIALNRALQDVIQWWIPRELHITTYNGLPTRTKLEMLAKEGIVSETQFDTISDLKQQKVIEIIEEKCVYDVLKVELLDELFTLDYKIGCVTNSIRKTTEMMLRRTGVYSHMDIIVTNEDIQTPKPDPEGYLKAMRDLGVTPGNTWIVEDSPKGLEAAIASGANVIQVENAEQVTEDLVIKYNL